MVWLERSLYPDHLLGVGIPAVIDLYISGKKVKKLALFTISQGGNVNEAFLPYKVLTAYNLLLCISICEIYLPGQDSTV